jgi:hypothetical protein
MRRIEKLRTPTGRLVKCLSSRSFMTMAVEERAKADPRIIEASGE